MLQGWTARWTEDCRRTERVVRPGTDPGGHRAVPEDTLPNTAVLKNHSGLRKAESSVLVQARTGRIGLAKFLYNCKVPGVLSASGDAGPEERHLGTWLSTALKKQSAASIYGQAGG